MHKEKMKLIAFNNRSWKLMEKYMSEIKDFFDQKKECPMISELLAISIKLVLSEFILNPQYYDKYSPKIWSDDDLINIIIDDIGSLVPDINEFKDNEEYIDKFRNIIWAHMKMLYTKNSSRFFRIINNTKTVKRKLVKKDMDILLDCLVVVWVESILRKKEHLILEHSYI